MDTFSKSERSKIMASVKSRGNKSTEIQFVSILKDKGITGWRRNYSLIGNPDFVFPRERTAVFIDGCFWHSCPLHCRMPASNKNYWNNKIDKNRIRDKKITRTLRAKGWQVVRVWEHEIKSGKLNHKLNRMHNKSLQ
ncbi:MAG: very short patch repair endonuclease [Nitrospiraceae bacterium]|nr:MAG: very short patch repair endonuclease [Nitrospiraceae bacterium]